MAPRLKTLLQSAAFWLLKNKTLSPNQLIYKNVSCSIFVHIFRSDRPVGVKALDEVSS
jgi:hypothetical protein